MYIGKGFEKYGKMLEIINNWDRLVFYFKIIKGE